MTGCRRTIVLGGLLATGACSSDATEVEPAAADAPAAEAEAVVPPAVVEAPSVPGPPPSGHAVAKVGSLLFFSSTGELGFELPPLGEGTTAAPGMTINVTGEQDGRLVAETLVAEPAEHHCAATLEGLRDFRLRLYLAPDDLLPVLTDELRHEHEDGTMIRLTRGVPVPEGSAELLVRGTAVRVPVPAERLGRFYEPGSPFSSEPTQGVLRPLEGHALTYGGHVLDESSLFHDGDALAHFGSTLRDADALVTVRNPCLEITALVADARLHALPPPLVGPRYALEPAPSLGADEEEWGALMGTEVGEAYGFGGLGFGGLGVVGPGGVGSLEPTYEVKAGTAIMWPDGSPAGQVIVDHRFVVAPREHGGLMCVDAALVDAKGPAVTLCFTPGDVSMQEPAAVAGFGTIGLGSSGAGTGSSHGTGGFGGRGKKVPTVRQAKAAVTGSLDKDIIRRIVRAHLNEVRYCYNQGLTKDPTLEGKVEVRFTISGTGSVSAADVASTTISDANVGQCIAKAVKRWTFPKPTGGGLVLVTYPFVLSAA